LTRTRFTVRLQRRVPMATLLLAVPPLGSFARQTCSPVSAFSAKTQPRLLAT
jgi:hypothetical protein